MRGDRRQFLLGAIASVGGTALLSACGSEPALDATLVGVNEPGRFYTLDEIQFVARLCDMFFPQTETPGAIDANLHGHLDALMADWAAEDTKAAQRLMLTNLKTELDTKLGDDFTTAPRAEAVAALEAFDAATFDTGETVPGYKQFKLLAEQIFMSTEEGAYGEYGYEPVPGRWEPAARLTQ